MIEIRYLNKDLGFLVSNNLENLLEEVVNTVGEHLMVVEILDLKEFILMLVDMVMKKLISILLN